MKRTPEPGVVGKCLAAGGEIDLQENTHAKLNGFDARCADLQINIFFNNNKVSSGQLIVLDRGKPI